MIDDLVVRARTALSPEWDHGFDEAFTELVSSDPDLVQAEFDDLIAASWPDPSGPGRPPGSPAPVSRAASPGTPAPEPPEPPQEETTGPFTGRERPPP